MPLCEWVPTAPVGEAPLVRREDPMSGLVMGEMVEIEDGK